MLWIHKETRLAHYVVRSTQNSIYEFAAKGIRWHGIASEIRAYVKWTRVAFESVCESRWLDSTRGDADIHDSSLPGNQSRNVQALPTKQNTHTTTLLHVHRPQNKAKLEPILNVQLLVKLLQFFLLIWPIEMCAEIESRSKAISIQRFVWADHWKFVRK